MTPNNDALLALADSIDAAACRAPVVAGSFAAISFTDLCNWALELRVTADGPRAGGRKAAEAKQIRQYVDRFLAWRLPDDFQPDGGISFKADLDPLCWPIGTNLLNETQARAMLTDVLGLTQSQPVESGACNWHQQDNGGDHVSTSCGHEFVLNDASDYEDGKPALPYCAYCAKPCVFHLWNDEKEAADDEQE